MEAQRLITKKRLSVKDLIVKFESPSKSDNLIEASSPGKFERNLSKNPFEANKTSVNTYIDTYNSNAINQLSGESSKTNNISSVTYNSINISNIDDNEDQNVQFSNIENQVDIENNIYQSTSSLIDINNLKNKWIIFVLSILLFLISFYFYFYAVD